MLKVLIWDYTDAVVSASWLEQVANINDIEVVGTITPEKPTPKILLDKDAWDWLLIFEEDMRDFFEVTIQILKLPPEKIVYALDIKSWMQHSKAAFVLANPARGGDIIHLSLHLILNQQLNKFVACTVEGLSYVSTFKDNVIMHDMYINRVNFAEGEMKLFYALSKKYYNVDDSTGYFLDLGANIGTTSIYFTKKLAPNLKGLAFESDAENFNLLRVNLILNDMEDKAIVVNRELSEPIDEYLTENKIAASEIKYLWIDTEGMEPQILLGAKNLISENPVPIFMGCNLNFWKESEHFDPMMELLTEHYSHFILNGEEEFLYPLETLRTLEISSEESGNIFLIKKGAID